MSNPTETRVPCSRETREQLWGVKRGKETFDDLFQQMLEQYDPDAVGDGETTKTPA